MKKAATKEERLWMEQVAGIGCVICGSPAEIHHIREHTGLSKRPSHFETIGLCPRHHRTGGFGVAVHAGREEWEKRHGKTQQEFLEEVKQRIKWL